MQWALLAALPFLLYLPSLHGGFLWDDELLSTKNPLFYAADPWTRIWLTTDASDYYPLTWSLLYLEWRWFGTATTGYHLVSLLLHISGTLLVWRVLRALEIPGAWLAALIFAIHPVNAATVAWMSQTKNTLSLVFFAAATLCWVKDHSRWSLGLYVAGLLSKSSGILLPLVLLACTWWRRGRLERRDLIVMIPFLVAMAVMAAVTVWFQHVRAMGGEPTPSRDVATILTMAGWVFWFYVLHVLVPIGNTMVYALGVHAKSMAVPLPGALAWVPSAALGGVVIVACWTRWRPGIFALTCVLAMLLPVLGLVDMFFLRFSYVSDHLQYLASIGVIAFVVAGLARLPAVVGTVVVALFCVLTWHHEQGFLSAENLWRDTIAKNPRAWVAHINLGSVFEDQRKYAEAVDAYNRALADAPPDRALWYNLGHALAMLGRNEEAARAYRESLNVDERYAEAHNNLGIVLEALHRPEEALRHYQRALLYRADYPEAHNNAGTLLADLGWRDLAVRHLREALRLRPHNNAQAATTLAKVCLDEGRVDEALPLLAQALRDDPSYAAAHRQMGRAMARQQRLAEAETALAEANRLVAGDNVTLNLWGDVAQRQGATRIALERFAAAARARPDDPLAWNNIAWIRATARDPRLRNGKEAVALARQACALVPDNPLYLDTLAAALAEAGNFREAVIVGTEAMSLGEDKAIAARVARYRAGKPWRE